MFICQPSKRIVRKIYERERADPMENLDVNAAIWSIFLNTTLQAAFHLRQDYEVNFRFAKNHLWNSVEKLFNETRRLIFDQTEIIGVTNDWFRRTYMELDKLIVQQSLLDHTCENLHLLRLGGLCGKMGDDPIAA